VGEQLSAVGLATYAVDLHGRRQSDGERFYVQQFGESVADVSALVALAKSRHVGLRPRFRIPLEKRLPRFRTRLRRS
jgi:hypothetical protein